MNIDLSQALIYAGNDIKNRAQLKSILSDLYPDRIQDINVILMIYESGIPDEIKNFRVLDERNYSYYLERITRDYGLKEDLAREALNVWVEALLGKDASKPFCIPENHLKKPEKTDGSEFYVNHGASSGKLHTVDNLEYEVRDTGDDEVELSLYWGGSSNILIPALIEGKTVSGIGAEAFMRRQSVVKAKIQNGIRYISEGAFKNCVNLESVSFPPSLTVIGAECFRNCEALCDVHLSEGLKELKEKTFFNCPSLKKLLVPSSLETIGEKVFSKNMQPGLIIYCDLNSYAYEVFSRLGFTVEDAEEYEIYL